MNKYLYFLLLAFCIYLTIRNFMMIKRNKTDKVYVECYRKVIACEEDALENATNYINNETAGNLKHKALIMKLIQELSEGKDYQETLNAINPKEFTCNNGKFSDAIFAENSDGFLWILVAFAKANKFGKTDVIDSLYKKLEEIEGVKTKVEYRLVESFYGILKGTGNTEFIKKFLVGEYEGCTADKKIISLDKRFAEAILDYSNEELDEISKGDIPNFAKTQLGEFFMKDLGIFEKYNKEEEQVQDESYLDIENKEEESNKEEE